MGTIVLKDNMEYALKELYKLNNIEITQNVLFEISINENEKAKMKSRDLLYFPYCVIKHKLLGAEEVIKILSGPRCTFPLWIDMSLVYHDEEKLIIHLQCSCRFRKSAELHNQDAGFQPFRVI